MKLTDHFQLSEFTRSGTANRYGINNSLNPDNPQQAEIIANLKALCENVLEPLRQHLNRPVIISSGYRCPQLNNHPEVRGATKSQHMKGEAADLRIPSLSEGRKWMEWIIDHTSFDQCIMEHSSKPRGVSSSLEQSRGAAESRRSQHCKNKDGSTSHWIHVSYSRKHNRQYVISSMWKK